MLKGLTQSQPLYQQAYDEIKRSILTGEMSSGSRLVVTKLAEKYQVSRTPLREALRQLQKEGLLVQDHLGLKVVRLDQKDFEELCHCRLLLEKEIAEFIIHDISDETLAKAGKVLDKAEYIVKEEYDLKKFLDHNAKFHEILIHASTNKRLIQLLETVRSLLILYRAKAIVYSGKREEINKEHRTILNAFIERDLEKARIAIEEHLKNDYKRAIQSFEDNR